MTLQQLHYAITIAETGSLSRAAEILYVSQPTLTVAVRELEKELGIVIFNRSGKGTTLTNDGTEFLLHARQLYQQYDSLLEKYGKNENLKKKFGLSTQHYSFAVKAFVSMVQKFDISEFEFAVRETKTREVIDDVKTLRSEIGIIYINDFNRKAILKVLKSNDIEFHKLIECGVYVYMWKGHPLAKRESITFEELKEYPCLSFEQGDGSSFYFAEEMMSTKTYEKIIKANDRATMLNLMVGLNGYTLCSGIICEELNGTDYRAVPLRGAEEEKMEIGYIVRKNMIMSKVGEMYIKEIKEYLKR